MEDLKLVARLREKTIPSCSSYVILSDRQGIIYIEDHIYYKAREKMTEELWERKS